MDCGALPPLFFFVKDIFTGNQAFVRGQCGKNNLIAPNGVNSWNLSGAGSGAGFTNFGFTSFGFTGFENLTGGAGNDTFFFLPGATVPGMLNGGTGTDILNFASFTPTAATNPSKAAAAAGLTVNLQTKTISGSGGFVDVEGMIGTGQADTLIAANIANVWSLTERHAGSVNGFSFVGVENLTGGSAADTFGVSQSASAWDGTVSGANGTNTLQGDDTVNAWTITGPGAVELQDIAFTGISNLKGGAKEDAFSFAAGAALAGTIDGGAGTDTLDYADYAAAITMNLLTKKANGAKSFTGIEGVVGCPTYTDTLVAGNLTNAWTVDGAGAGTLNGFAFTSLENLTGGTKDDTFTVGAGGSWSGLLQGSGGSDTLVGVNVWAVTASGGTLNGARFAGVETWTGAGTQDTLIGPDTANIWSIASTTGKLGKVNYSGMENLTGGAKDDTFVFTTGAVVGLVDGGAGRNTLDYSGYPTAVVVDLPSGAATAAGGVANMQIVVGSAGNDQLMGDSGDNVLLGGAGSDTLVGGDGRDLLVGGSDADASISGGAGEDILIAGKFVYFNESNKSINAAALSAVMAEWTRTDLAYDARVKHLLAGGGLNGSTKLAKASIIRDTVIDPLLGGDNLAWFLQGTADTNDRATAETATII